MEAETATLDSLLDESRETFAAKFADHEHWVIVAHPLAARLLIEIEKRYYKGEKAQDFTKIIADHGGYSFTVVAARKRHMLTYQFASLIRQTLKIPMGERALISRDLQFMAPSEAMDAAYELADKLFEWREKSPKMR